MRVVGLSANWSQNIKIVSEGRRWWWLWTNVVFLRDNHSVVEHFVQSNQIFVCSDSYSDATTTAARLSGQGVTEGQETASDNPLPEPRTSSRQRVSSGCEDILKLVRYSTKEIH
ncbi:hypothetical protein J6590_034724 [Homalodisca vitripennis]|nr:hypothetical protein J6590_034724 [Homalodisca vitripennis]